MDFMRWSSPGGFHAKRDPGFVLRSFARGVLPVAVARPRLDTADLEAIAEIEKRLEASPDCSFEYGKSGLVRYVREEIVRTKRLREMAVDVKWVERLLDRWKPQLLVTDGLDYNLCQIFLIVAKKRGISTAAMWHGTFNHDVKIDVLGNDPRVDSVVDWFFTWGKLNEDWLNATSAKTKVIRTGNPIALPTQKSNPRGDARERVLLLQYSATHWDLAWPQARQFNFFVESLRMLRELGFSDIRVKLHPGGAPTAYYREVADYFGLDCPIYRDEPFEEHLAWSEFVIGPVGSGAMLEAFGAGKTYYPMLLNPHAVNMGYFDGHPIYSSVEELRAALLSGEPPDFTKLVSDFTSLDQIPDPSRYVWEVIKKVLSENIPSTANA